MSGEKEFKTNYLLSRGDSANQSINVVVVVIVVDIYCFSSKPRISLLWSRCSSILHMYCHIGILKYTYQSLGSKTVFQASNGPCHEIVLSLFSFRHLPWIPVQKVPTVLNSLTFSRRKCENLIIRILRNLNRSQIALLLERGIRNRETQII